MLEAILYIAKKNLMRNLVLFLLFVLSPSITISQPCDSLLRQSITLTASVYNDSALVLARDAVQCFEGTDSFALKGRADALFQIAYIWFIKGDVYNAIRFADSADFIYKSHLDTLNDGYMMHLVNLGQYFNTAGQFEKALSAYQRIVNNYHIQHLDSCENWYYGKLNMVQTLSTQGFYEKANAITKELTELYLGKFSRKDTFYFHFINELGFSYHKLGQYEKAIATYEKYIDPISDTTNYHIYEYNDIINNLGYFYYLIGDIERAIYIHETLLKYKLVHYTKEPIRYAWTLNHLGNFYGRKRQFEKAEQYLLESAKIKQGISGTENLWFALSENNLGILYSDWGKYDFALDYQKKLLNRTIGNPLFERQFVATFLHSYATTFHRLKNYDSALTYYHKALNLRKEVFGIHHISYLETLDAIIKAYIEHGDDGTAMQYATENISLMNEYLISSISVFTEGERNKIIRKFSTAVDVYYSLLYRQELNVRGEMAIRESFFIKALSLNESKRLLASVYKSTDSITLALLHQWNALKTYIAKQYSQPLKAQSVNIQDSVSRLVVLERQLSALSVSFNDYSGSFDFKLSELRDQLTMEQALMECISFHYFGQAGWTDSTLHVALLCKKQDSAVKWIYLVEDSRLTPFLSDSVVSLTYSNQYTLPAQLKTRGSQFYNLLWAQVAREMGGIKTVYISPSGNLNRIAFAAIPVPGKNEYLGDRFRFITLNSMRGLTEQNTRHKVKDVLTMGGILYNIDSSKYVNKTEFNKLQFDNVFTAAALRTAEERIPFEFLKNTYAEVVEISNTCKKYDINHKILVKDSATEEFFKSMNRGSPTVMHIATHGFYLKFKQLKTKEDLSQTNFSLIEDPMFRSGIALTGANLKWFYNIDVPGTEDGILTAFEIAQMDLSKTELVVLSACESGLGDIDGSEGIFGLQRGFKSAGVNKMIVSLWKVPDGPAKEFMTNFYEQWLSGKKDIRTAFYDTQKQMSIRYRRFPQSWAGFVLIE